MEPPISSNSNSVEHDPNHVIHDLYNSLDIHPKSIDAYERLVEAWDSIGEKDMAVGVATALLDISPTNNLAKVYLRLKGTQQSQEPTATSGNMSREEVRNAGNRLEEEYPLLMLEAEMLRLELEAAFPLKVSEDQEKILSNLLSITQGKISSAIHVPQPVSVREAARRILTAPARSQELIVEDFESVFHWSTAQIPPPETDSIRERLAKRKSLLEAALPDSMQQDCLRAFTVVEREFFQRKYENSETMLGDRIEDIPKANLFVSEDNYAWDMDELVSALVASDGIMRNPLSKQMFSEADIGTILAHPLGQRVKPIRMNQDQLKKGVRPTTINKVETLGDTMLNDQSVDAGPSRKAMDEFLAYMATLPDKEQKTLNNLKVPAMDRYTGQPFDYSIGESVRDAKANTTCFHKVGDFLSQAAKYLRRQ